MKKLVSELKKGDVIEFLYGDTGVVQCNPKNELFSERHYNLCACNPARGGSGICGCILGNNITI